jgi:hypothetical protein
METMSTPLPPSPPKGFASWLDFAVETFDTRGPWVEGLFSDDAPPDRDAMRETARTELAKLRQQAVDARTALAGANFAPKGIYRFKTHEDANRQEEAWLAEGMARLALDRKKASDES